MLVVDTINTFYGFSHILHDVSFEVHDGEIVVLLGRNGVGKTTSLKSIMGLQPPRSGNIVFHDEDITGLRPHEIARRGIALIPEDRRIFPNLTVLENLKMGMIILGRDIDQGEALEMVFHFFPRLRERLSQLGGSLSGGEQQMLTIARGLVSNPGLMMIDEPTEGVAPILVMEIEEILKRLHNNGVTILLVEQNYQMSLGLSSKLRAYIIEKGQIKMCGTPEELVSCEAEVERYLGVKLAAPS